MSKAAVSALEGEPSFLAPTTSWQTLGASVCRTLEGEQVERSSFMAVLDLNGVLVERLSTQPKHRAASKAAHDFRPPSRKLHGRKIWVRPYVADFLTYLCRRCTVGVWSSATTSTVDGLLNIVFRDTRISRKSLLFVHDRKECVHDTAKGGFATLKPLEKIWSDERFSARCDPSNTIIFDDSISKASLNPLSVVVIPEYTSLNLRLDYNRDETLLWTAMYLELLLANASVPDIRVRIQHAGDLASFIARGQVSAMTQTGQRSVRAFLPAGELSLSQLSLGSETTMTTKNWRSYGHGGP